MSALNFKIEKKLKNSLGRAGFITTPHGEIKTPAFVTVGTKATVKAMTPEQIKEAGTQVVLANTYHLYLQPGDELVKEAGGIHRFLNWSGPTMTDSGGFQVFSLGVAYGLKLSKVGQSSRSSDESDDLGKEILQIPERSSALDGVPRLATIGNDGVSFRSHLDGSLHYITPEKSIEIQHNLGADIIFAFDECTSPTENERYQEEALARTHAWAKRSLERHLELEKEKANNFGKMLSGDSHSGLNMFNELDEAHVAESTFQNSSPQALFGIVQGGRSKELRQKSAKIISEMRVSFDGLCPATDEVGFAGFGIGGSFTKEDMSQAVKWVNEILPEDRPRHLLGIGEPEDLFMGVENGVDLFDCVGPTRLGRNGTLFTKNGKINILNTQFIKDFGPIDEGCGCYTCQNYTLAYLSHLFRAKEMLGATLATIHNVYFINKLVSDMREAILEEKFLEFKKEFLQNYLK